MSSAELNRGDIPRFIDEISKLMDVVKSLMDEAGVREILNQISSRIRDFTENISTCSDGITAAEAKITKAEKKIKELEEKIEMLETQIGILEAELATCFGGTTLAEMAAIEARREAIEAKISSLERMVKILNAEILRLQGCILQLRTCIAELSQIISDNNDSINTLRNVRNLCESESSKCGELYQHILKLSEFSKESLTKAQKIIEKYINYVIHKHSETNPDIHFIQGDENKKLGLSLTQEEQLINKTGWSYDIVKYMRTPDEADVYLECGLYQSKVNGRDVLKNPNIEFDKCYNDLGLTNLELMKMGRAPLTKDGLPFELHHEGQKSDSPFAELPPEKHRGSGYYSRLHTSRYVKSEIDREVKYPKEHEEHWKARAKEYEEMQAKGAR